MLPNSFVLLRLNEDHIHDHPYVLKGANDCFGGDGRAAAEPEDEEGGRLKEDSPSLGRNMLKEAPRGLHLMEDTPQEEALGEVGEDELDLKGQDKLQVRKIQEVLKGETKDPPRSIVEMDTVEEGDAAPLGVKEKEDLPQKKAMGEVDEDEKHLEWETGVEVVHDEENGKPGQDGGEICPTRMFCGRLYDFRCIYCKVLPREGRVSRSELYRHYAVKHFSQELRSEYGDLVLCPICGMKKKSSMCYFLSHLGQVHDKVENYLPEEAKIPRDLLQPRGKHVSMRTSGVVGSKANKKTGVFPAIPESCSRFELFQGKREEEFVGRENLGADIVDGFIIEDVMVVEEAEEFGHPHTDENLKCAICEEMFSRGVLNQAVKHMEELHGVRGLRPQLNISLSRLISAGYLLRPDHTSD